MFGLLLLLLAALPPVLGLAVAGLQNGLAAAAPRLWRFLGIIAGLLLLEDAGNHRGLGFLNKSIKT